MSREILAYLPLPQHFGLSGTADRVDSMQEFRLPCRVNCTLGLALCTNTFGPTDGTRVLCSSSDELPGGLIE